MGAEFQFRKMKKCSRWSMLIVAEYCEQTQCHQILHLQMVKTVNLMLCTSYCNKNKVTFQNESLKVYLALILLLPHSLHPDFVNIILFLRKTARNGSITTKMCYFTQQANHSHVLSQWYPTAIAGEVCVKFLIFQRPH